MIPSTVPQAMVLAQTTIEDGGQAVQLLILIGGLSLVPALLFTVTGFTRILIVLGFIRTGLGTPTAPPNQVLVGIALFLTMFVMGPTLTQVKDEAIQPMLENKISVQTAFERAEKPMRDFMFRQTRDRDLALFVKMADLDQPKTRADIPTRVLIPSFILSELKTAFQIGFLIFLPFLVIDLVVSSTLMSMGMVMLPPVFISLPFKILLFVLVDGWSLITQSLVESFNLWVPTKPSASRARASRSRSRSRCRCSSWGSWSACSSRSSKRSRRSRSRRSRSSRSC